MSAVSPLLCIMTTEAFPPTAGVFGFAEAPVAHIGEHLYYALPVRGDGVIAGSIISSQSLDGRTHFSGASSV